MGHNTQLLLENSNTNFDRMDRAIRALPAVQTLIKGHVIKDIKIVTTEAFRKKLATAASESAADDYNPEVYKKYPITPGEDYYIEIATDNFPLVRSKLGAGLSFPLPEYVSCPGSPFEYRFPPIECSIPIELVLPGKDRTRY